MNTIVKKWGNSLAIRLPKPLAEQLGIVQESVVDLTLKGNTLSIQLAEPPEYTLDELLAGITDENLHEAVDVEDGVGLEVW
ncbi:MAG: AbrB/MazE/SpoVT family DNA-binding domain-containing protein [Spirulina sp. SIO3F2]|nr:AbrB/MazE/SpoVT family DNA-binding domain-containing protein [Spirulina sp. SIO3F2]